ncbi:class II aldolase/adducin family protein [Thiohalorhabdus methylotrophus]|uniref:Class II aldolase/adducin family protein n=1 Tax=Thiohalorhabdus methylotrophus TaxID=3242694 RepID=A0ABV4TW68_9GAMM
MRHITARRSLVAAMDELGQAGLNQGASGNVGLRVPGGLLITPSGVPYEQLRPGDLVEQDMEGGVVQGRLRPSSEWRFHRDILAAYPETDAVVHVHSPYATALACLNRPIPAFHYMVAVAGGMEIPLAPYATFGSQELSDQLLAAMGDLRACLLANHGLVVRATGLEQALGLAREVENLARQYLLALQAGDPVLLGLEEMERVLERFAGYGPGGGD